MNFTVNSNDILKGLLIAQKAIPAKTTDPIQENYLLDIKGSTLEITGADGEIMIKTRLEVSSTTEEGQAAVPARMMTELLKEIPDQPLVIKTVSESAFLCQWVDGESMIPYFNPADYPLPIKPGEGSFTVSLDTDTMGNGIASTVYASSDEQNRPVMNSIFFDIKPESTTLVASDLQKLICFVTDGIKSAEPCSIILNKRHANVLKAILPKENEPLTISFDSKVALISFGQTDMYCSLVVGKYPDYKTIIPKNNSNILRMERSRLLNTVRRIAVCSPKASNHIKFELTPGFLEISAQDLGFEMAAHEKIACTYEGDELVIGFKSTHLVDILSNIASESIIMKFADRRRSILILPDDEASSQQIFGIVMPIMVK